MLSEFFPSAESLLVIQTILLMLAPAALLLWWHWRRRLRAEEELFSVRIHAQTLRQCLATSPDGWFAWFSPAPAPAGGEGDLSDLPRDNILFSAGLCSRRAAVMLDLTAGQAATFGDILDALAPASAQRLRQACLRLRQEGESFDILLTHSGSFGESVDTLPRRSLRITGMQALDEDGQLLADILWLRDVSAEEAIQTTLATQTLRMERQGQVFRDALDSLPAPVWLRDDDLGITFANRAFLEAAGIEAPPGKSAALAFARLPADERELAPGTVGRELRALASAARAAGETRHASVHLVLRGRRRLVDISETALPPSTGPGDNSARLTVGLAHDMTRLEALRATLEQEATSHATVLERLGTAIAIFGKDTRLHFHNTAYARLWDLDSGWLDSSPAYGEVMETLRDRRLLPEVADYPAWRAAELGRFTSLLEPVEDLLHLPDGQTLRRVLAPHPLGGLLATYEDVSDRLALEASRNQLEAVQRETLDHLHEAVAVFGADSRLQLHNPAFARMWDLPESLLSSRHPHLNDLLARLPEGLRDHPAWAAMRDLLAASASLRTVRQCRIERPLRVPGQGSGDRMVSGDRTVNEDRQVNGDGEVKGGENGNSVTLDFIGVPLPDGAVLFTFLDMSDTARAEKALRERAEALTAADQQKSRFISSMSSELRTPLSAIQGFSGILADEYYGPLNSRQKEYARNISETASQLVTLITDMSDLVSLESGLTALDPDSFDIHATLATVLAQTREMVRKKDLVINFDCQPDIGSLRADEKRIHQVLANLLGNAIKYTPEGGQITLAAQRQDQPAGVLFTVADTGCGISREEQQGIFDRFTRVGPGQGGSGVGLALVKRFVELHGGTVELVSVPAEGTTVTLFLPG